MNAQQKDLVDVYHQEVAKRDLSHQQKEQLLDSLLQQKDFVIDSLQLIKTYRSIIQEMRFSNLKKSIQLTEKVTEIAKLSKNLQTEDVQKNHRNKIMFLYRDQQFYRAIKEVEIYLERYPEKDWQRGKVYRQLGNIYSDLGDYEQAFQNYDKSIFILKSFNSDADLLLTYISKLETLVNLYDESYSDEILYLEKAIEALKKTENLSYGNEFALSLNLGVFYDYRKEYNTAISKYKNAYVLSKENKDTLAMAGSMLNLSSIHKNNGNIQESKAYIQEASKYIDDDDALNAVMANNLADIYQLENNHQQALIQYQKAITQALKIETLDYQTLPNFEAIEYSPNKLDILGYLIDKANGWIAFYESENNTTYLQYALETFTLADKLIDVIYVESREDLSKLFWRKKSATFYPKAVEVCYRLQQPEKAFFFMEKNKAMLLLENMTDATAKRLSKLPENVLIREQNLIKEIKTLESEIQATPHTNSTQIEALKNSVFNYKNEYNTFIDSLETNYPKYYTYKKNINIIALSEVQQNLQNDELILQYIIGKENGFVTLITAKKIQLQQLPKTEVLQNLINSYKNAVSKPFVSTDDKKEYEKVAQQLYQQLIPFAQEKSIENKKITIIADGMLQYIPFEALLTDRKEYLIEKAQIQYNYSLSSAAQSRQNDTEIHKNFIAIAPTTFKNEQFSTLATSSEELKKLTNIFDATHFQYEKASKAQFTSAYGNYKIIHLSTHGGIDNTVPWVAFYDEKLTLDELYFTKNRADLVVLSACKTSDGELKKGEGVMSLARGFFNAGAKSVVSSLWDINEKASTEIIQEFYKNMVAGDTKSEALQKAKIAYIQNHKNTSEASPYYWSALTLTGDETPIEISQNSYWYYLLGGIVLSGMIVFIRFKRRDKKSA
ncbi:CHAT domain-containing protein [Kordia periserrulae]|nr:CHAT domain-containing protein [Kordia periserrulae]